MPIPFSLEEWSEENKENIDLNSLMRTPRKRKASSKDRDEPQTPNLKRTKPLDKGEVTPKKNACREVLNAINKVLFPLLFCINSIKNLLDNRLSMPTLQIAPTSSHFVSHTNAFDQKFFIRHFRINLSDSFTNTKW